MFPSAFEHFLLFRHSKVFQVHCKRGIERPISGLIIKMLEKKQEDENQCSTSTLANTALNFDKNRWVLDWSCTSLKLQKWVVGKAVVYERLLGTAPAGDGQAHGLSQEQLHKRPVGTAP